MMAGLTLAVPEGEVSLKHKIIFIEERFLITKTECLRMRQFYMIIKLSFLPIGSSGFSTLSNDFSKNRAYIFQQFRRLKLIKMMIDNTGPIFNYQLKSMKLCFIFRKHNVLGRPLRKRDRGR